MRLLKSYRLSKVASSSTTEKPTEITVGKFKQLLRIAQPPKATRPHYCPFCDHNNPIFKIIHESDGVIGIENYARRHDVSLVFFPTETRIDSNCFTSICDISEMAWLNTFRGIIDYVTRNNSSFVHNGKFVLRIVLNWGIIGRQSVRHIHCQVLSGKNGLGSFCTVPGYPGSIELSTNWLNNIENNDSDNWTFIESQYPWAPLHALFIPPNKSPLFLNTSLECFAQLLIILRQFIEKNEKGFSSGGRLVINVGTDAEQLLTKSPWEAHFLGGDSDLGRYCYNPALPILKRMEELQKHLEKRASSLGKTYIGNYWEYLQPISTNNGSPYATAQKVTPSKQYF